MADVRYAVVVDASGAVTSVQKLDDAWDKLGKTGKATPNIFSAVSKEFKTMAAGFVSGQFIVDGIRKAFGFLKDTFVEGIKGASEAEASQVALSSALQLTGRTSQTALTSLMNFAQAQMLSTVYSNEQVESVMTLLVQLTKLDVAGIQRATKGTIGLASVMKMDLDSAARTVTKAMEGNYMALHRLGIKIDETLSPMEKQAALMDKLGVLYARAEAEANTFAGRMTQLKVAYGEVQESIGNVIIKNTELNELLALLKFTMDQFMGATTASSGPLAVFSGILGGVADQIKYRLGPLLAVLALEQAKANAEAKKISDAYDRGAELWERMGWATRTLVEGVDTLNDEQRKLLTTQKALFSDDINNKIKEGEVALGIYAKSAGATAQGVKNMETYINGLRDSLKGLNPVLAQAAQAMVAFGLDVSNPTVNAAFDALIDRAKTLGAVVGGELGRAIDFVEPKATGLFENMVPQVAAVSKEFQTLQAAYDTVQADIISGFTSIMDGTKSMGEIFSSTVTTMISGMGKLVIAEIMFAKTSIKGSMMQSIARHIANIFKSVPFPLDIILAAGAFGVVSKLFTGLLKFKEGAYFPTATMLPAHVVGDVPEYYLPERKLMDTIRTAMRMPAWGAAPAMATVGGGGGVIVNFNAPLISTVGLSDADIRRAGAKVKDRVLYEMHRLGR